jgi:kinesin family protein 5
MHNNVGEICCKVIEGTTIYFPNLNQSFDLDHVFDQTASQESIYEKVGKEAINDVLNGYNGTIFAYGQTGSGKTYTMFGPDIYNDVTKGIIPRAACDIFNVWDLSPETKEIDVRCSMLEIYKENLRDLLTDDPVELKIKESPIRGIYVEGLSEYSIVSEEELMCWVEVGEQRRVWAETCHNSVSSRSHTIFMLEVRQTFTNDSESRGILNLVDLAGSEKVGKSGAQGQIFEEGTKINLSLSALGNVIHALTSNMDHIPYRDSKLTRLLQESLGGNYKTALVVTCSPHSTQIQETLTTLKFAQRAKKIKNRIRVNIKNSPDQLAKVIEDLREELRKKDERIEKLLVQTGGVAESLEVPMLFSSDPSSTVVPSPNKKPIRTCHLKLEMKRCKSEEKMHRKHCSQSITGPVSEESKATICEGEKIEEKSEEVTPKYAELELENEKLKKRVAELTKHVENLTRENGNLEYKLKQAEITLMEEKKKVLSMEGSLGKLQLEMEDLKNANEKVRLKENGENVQLQIYENQVNSLITALEDTEGECFKLLKERKEKVHRDAVEMCSLTLVEYMTQAQFQVPVLFDFAGFADTL